MEMRNGKLTGLVFETIRDSKWASLRVVVDTKTDKLQYVFHYCDIHNLSSNETRIFTSYKEAYRAYDRAAKRIIGKKAGTAAKE